jgi:hypothetical protein
MAKEPKWGHLDDIDYRTRVGSDAWKKRHPENIQKLSAFRYLHEIAEHPEVRDLADATVEEMLKAVDEHRKEK